MFAFASRGYGNPELYKFFDKELKSANLNAL